MHKILYQIRGFTSKYCNRFLVIRIYNKNSISPGSFPNFLAVSKSIISSVLTSQAEGAEWRCPSGAQAFWRQSGKPGDAAGCCLWACLLEASPHHPTDQPALEGHSLARRYDNSTLTQFMMFVTNMKMISLIHCCSLTKLSFPLGSRHRVSSLGHYEVGSAPPAG